MRLKGSISLPGDKSIAHRYAMLGALAEGETRIANFPQSRDCLSTLACLRELGVEIVRRGDEVQIKGHGPSGLRPPGERLDAGNSGTTMRLLAGILAGQPFESRLIGDESLSRRPMRRIVEPLRLMGADIEAREDEYPPLAIRGGNLRAIDYRLPVASAQVKSCLLLAALYPNDTSRLEEPSPTRDHTERALRLFGADISVADGKIALRGGRPLRAQSILLPGDISSAAFFLVAALALPRSEVIIKRVGLNETRLGLIDLLKSRGAQIEIAELSEVNLEPVGDLVVRYSPQLLGAERLEIDGKALPGLIDEVPVLAVLGTQLAGGLAVTGARELRYKESDRISLVAENLRRMGAEVEELDDGLIVKGRQKLRGATIATGGDHRIAMAFAVAGLLAGGETQLDDPACVSVSFPSFFQTLSELIG